MKISKKPSSRKWQLAALTTGLVVLAGIGGAFYFVNNKKTDPLHPPIDYSPPTAEQSDAVDDVKERAIERGQTNTSQPEQTSNPVSLTATYEKGSSQVVVTTKLANSVSWDKCYLQLTQGQTTKNFEARTVYQPDSSFCGGFSVPASGMSGVWSVTLRATDLNGKSYENKTNVEIN